MSEYPDHLNPFKDSEKKKLGKTLTRSFRELKGFLRQSFRKKKSRTDKNPDLEDVEIRKPYGNESYNTLRGNVMSLPSPPTYNIYTSPPLPRSRFKERLSRSSLNDAYDERCNPFAEEAGTNPFEDPPVPYRRRKSKKRAPIVPSCSNPDVHYGFKSKGSSKWSLTSSETDYTIDDKSEYSGDVTYSHSLRECLDNFNKEMDSLNKGSIEMGGSSPNILGGARTKIIEDTEFTTKSADVLTATHNQEINNNTTYEPDSYKNDPNESESEEKVEEKVNGLHVANGIHENNDEDERKPERATLEEIDEERIDEELEKGYEEAVIYTETKDIDNNATFSIVNTKLAFIDQEGASSEQNASDSSEIEDTKEPSPLPKHRKIKLGKEALLGGALPNH